MAKKTQTSSICFMTQIADQFKIVSKQKHEVCPCYCMTCCPQCISKDKKEKKDKKKDKEGAAGAAKRDSYQSSCSSDCPASWCNVAQPLRENCLMRHDKQKPKLYAWTRSHAGGYFHVLG